MKLLDVTADIERRCVLAHKFTSGHESGEAPHRGSYSGMHVPDPWGRHILDEQINE